MLVVCYSVRIGDVRLGYGVCGIVLIKVVVVYVCIYSVKCGFFKIN